MSGTIDSILDTSMKISQGQLIAGTASSPTFSRGIFITDGSSMGGGGSNVKAPDAGIQPAGNSVLTSSSHSPITSSIQDIPLDELATLPPAQKLLLAENLFDEAEAELERSKAQAAKLHTDGMTREMRKDVWRQIEERMKWYHSVSRAIEMDLPPSDGLLFRNYRSSYGQALQNAADILDPAVPPTTVEKILSRNDTKRLYIDGNGYSVHIARGEMAFCVVFGLQSNAETYAWEGKRLVMNLPIEAPENSDRFKLLDLITWPPKPDDPILQAFQRILGWKFHIEISDDQVTFAIDFGESFNDNPKKAP
jgi:hypothetical protein